MKSRHESVKKAATQLLSQLLEAPLIRRIDPSNFPFQVGDHIRRVKQNRHGQGVIGEEGEVTSVASDRVYARPKNANYRKVGMGHEYTTLTGDHDEFEVVS